MLGEWERERKDKPSIRTRADRPALQRIVSALVDWTTDVLSLSSIDSAAL